MLVNACIYAEKIGKNTYICALRTHAKMCCSGPRARDSQTRTAVKVLTSHEVMAGGRDEDL